MSFLGLNVLKPKKPPKRGDVYFFPVTSADQVVTDEETDERLDGLIKAGIVKRTDVVDNLESESPDLPLSARMGSELNKNMVRYNSEKDMLQVFFNGEWVDVLQVYTQSKNWIPNVCTDKTNIFGEPVFKKEANASNNSATYSTDGYLMQNYSSSVNGISGFNSGNKIPLNVYSSVTIKYKQVTVYTNYPLDFSMVSEQVLRKTDATQYVSLGSVDCVANTTTQEITLDLSSYNRNGVEMYFNAFAIGNIYVYSITFNK